MFHYSIVYLPPSGYNMQKPSPFSAILLIPRALFKIIEVILIADLIFMVFRNKPAYYRVFPMSI